MKYIFFDIDNTLVSHVVTPHIPGETREAVKLLKRAGHIPAIATGRASFLTFLTAREFNINYIVCSGGAEIFSDGHEIYTQYFPDEYLKEFYELSEKFPELTAAADKKYIYTNETSGMFGKYFNAQAGYDCVRKINEMKRALMCYIMIPPKNLTSEHGIFYSPPEGVRLELMNAFTEARNSKTTKWNGIELLIKHEKADINDVITFGDGPNDVEMIQNAKIGVAVKKSSEIVKTVADYICDDIDEGGILKACRELGLV